MSERGKFIVLEGLDGSGKTFQAKLLSDRFINIGVRNRLTEEHWRGDVLGLAIDTVVELKKAKLDPLALQMTFLANRVNHTMVFIRPSLEEGYSVISNRYSESTINYADDIDRPLLIDLTKRLIKMGKIIRPDLTILVDVPVEEVIERLECRRLGIIRPAEGKLPGGLTLVALDGDKRGRESIFEKGPKLERVRNNYLERFNGSDKRMIIVDGVGTIKEVSGRIQEEIQRRKIIKI